MREENYIKLRIAYLIDDNFNILFCLLLWVLKYKIAFYIVLVLIILTSWARGSELSKFKKELNK